MDTTSQPRFIDQSNIHITLFYINDDRTNLLIVPKERVDQYFKKYTVVKEISDDKLVGVQYELPFTCYEEFRTRSCFRTFGEDFISAENGTTIVHCEPAFGEEDYNTFIKEEVFKPDDEVPCHVDENGDITLKLKDYCRSNMNMRNYCLKYTPKVLTRYFYSK